MEKDRMQKRLYFFPREGNTPFCQTETYHYAFHVPTARPAIAKQKPPTSRKPPCCRITFSRLTSLPAGCTAATCFHRGAEVRFLLLSSTISSASCVPPIGKSERVLFLQLTRKKIHSHTCLPPARRHYERTILARYRN